MKNASRLAEIFRTNDTARFRDAPDPHHEQLLLGAMYGYLHMDGTATPNNGYGYHTWITSRPRAGGDPSRFAALGLHGQAIFVDPARKLVVVHTAAWADGRDRHARGAQFKLFDAILAKLESQ